MRCVRRIRQTYQYLILFLTALHVNFIFLQVTTEYKAFIGFTFSCSIFKNKNINIEMCDAKRIRQYITLLASVMYWHSSEVSIHEVFKKLISVNLTHNFRQKTFRIVIIGFTDILSEEHKFTYVWLKSWKRAVLNRKIISGVGKENWHWVNMVELSPPAPHSACPPLLSSPFAPCWRKPSTEVTGHTRGWEPRRQIALAASFPGHCSTSGTLASQAYTIQVQHALSHPHGTCAYLRLKSIQHNSMHFLDYTTSF